MPWITRGILVSMGIRDTLYKTWTKEKDSQFKDRIVALYKCYRNMIVTIFSSFFIENQNYAKKTWDIIIRLTCQFHLKWVARKTDGVLINVLKKKNSTPTKLIYKNKEKTNNIEMAE